MHGIGDLLAAPRWEQVLPDFLDAVVGRRRISRVRNQSRSGNHSGKVSGAGLEEALLQLTFAKR